MTGAARAVAWTASALAAIVVLAFDPSAEGLERHHLIKEVVLGIGATALLATTWRRPRLDAIDGAVLALVAIDGCASIGAIDADVAWRQLAITAASVAVAIAVRGLSPAARAQLDHALLALMVLLSAWMIAESYGLSPRVSLRSYAPGVGVGQRNNAAHLLAIAISLAAVPALRELSVPRLLALAPMVTALVLTRSRAGWLAAGVGLLVALAVTSIEARSARARAVPVLGLLAAIAAGIALPVMVRPTLAWRSAHPYADSAARLFEASEGSGHGRLVQWQTSLALLAEHPVLGVGPGHWAIHYPRIAEPGDTTVHPDAWAPTSRLCTSDVVAWLTERGLLGLLGLVVAAGLLARALLRSREVSERARLAGLAALAVIASLDCSLQIALGSVALMALVPTRSEPAMAPTPARMSAGRAALALLALLLLASVPRSLERARHAHLRPDADAAMLETLGEDRFDVITQQVLVDRTLLSTGCSAALPRLEGLARIRPYLPRVRQSVSMCRGEP